MTMEVYFWTITRGVFLMRGVNDWHHSDISCRAPLKVLTPDLLSFLKTRLVILDGWKEKDVLDLCPRYFDEILQVL